MTFHQFSPKRFLIRYPHIRWVEVKGYIDDFFNIDFASVAIADAADESGGYFPVFM